MAKPKVGDRFESDACPDCGHRATGLITDVKEYEDRAPSDGSWVVSVTTSVRWDPPPMDCACDCHFAWRLVNGKPATPVQPDLHLVAS